MAVSRAQSETGSVVNTKYGARPIIDLPAFAFQQNVNYNSNLADVPQRMYGPKEYSYNVGRNVPRDNSQGGYVGQYYNYPNQMSPRGYQNSSNLVKESNVVPYPSYTTLPCNAGQQPSIAPQAPHGQTIQQSIPQQNGGSEKEVHIYYGPNGERLPGPPTELFKPRTIERKRYPMNFKIEATLEYGKMVTVRIVEGNVSFRDIPDFVLNDCQKTYRMAPKTEVTIVAENGEYDIYATPDLVPPLVRLYDRNKPDRRGYHNRSYSPERFRPEHDIYTKKYNGDYFDENRRRHTTQDYEPRGVKGRHFYNSGRDPHAEMLERHWYSSDRDRRAESMDRSGVRDPQRKPLPMKPMNLRKHDRTA